MSNFITKFNTHTAYNTYITGNNKILPNVSYCEDNNEVHYSRLEDYSQDYLTFVALENTTFTFTPTNNNVISYSTDGGENWAEENSVTVNNGDNVMWKGQLTPTSNGIGTFSSTGNFNVQGNAMSLLYGDNFKGQTALTGTSKTFYSLFDSCTKLISAENLSLPATTLVEYCYSDMFRNCSALVTAPELPATTLASNCYYYMFNGCTALVTVPELPATTLAEYCYCNMFRGCTSLVTAPELPATTLATDCYGGMFYCCTALVTTPELPATTLATDCYSSMFNGCTSLTTPPELPATTLASSCYNAMFWGCASLTEVAVVPDSVKPVNSSYCYTMYYNCNVPHSNDYANEAYESPGGGEN